MVFAETPVITGPAAALFTVTGTAVAVPGFPAASIAIAPSVCDPFATVVESQEIVYIGPGPVLGLPRFPPSKVNCTDATPTLSVALAETVTAVPVIWAPFDGAVMNTTGGVVSLVPRVLAVAILDEFETFPAASKAATVYV
jgi:hypothetical protein